MPHVKFQFKYRPTLKIPEWVYSLYLSEEGGDDGAEEWAAVDGEVEDGEECLQLGGLLWQLELITWDRHTSIDKQQWIQNW